MATKTGTNDRDIINGSQLPDLIDGLGGDDHLLGHDGDDVIFAGAGIDILEGGRGNDRLVAQGDAFSGSLGDSLFGGEDSDILVSSGGSDLLAGGSGIDAASWEASSGGVSANLSTGRATVGSSSDTLVQIENLIGSRFGDRLTGDAGTNELFGAAGNDVMFGGGGDDQLSGGAGNDTLDGGAGTNRLRGGGGVDTIDYLAQRGGVDIDLNSGRVVAQDRVDFVSEVEAARGSNFGDRLVGNGSANTLAGNGGADLIHGMEGNDALQGGTGADRIDGGRGDDALAGGTGADRFVFIATSPSRFSSATASGFDRITDFDFAGGDRVDLTAHKEGTTFADLRAQASQLGADTHLSLGDDTIVLEGVTLSELNARMFLF